MLGCRRVAFVVLERPAHPGNIGSVARAMKTTGFSNLILYQPEHFPHQQASQMATHGVGILDNAEVINDLDDFLLGMDLVIACSKRPRNIQIDHYPPDSAAYIVQSSLQNSAKVALLFGNETSGLANSTLDYANIMLEIPMADSTDSLNLSHAVQIVLYEIFKLSDHKINRPSQQEMPLPSEKLAFEDHLYNTIEQAGLIKHSSTFSKIRSMLRRMRPDRRELQLLFGLLNAVLPHPNPNKKDV